MIKLAEYLTASLPLHCIATIAPISEYPPAISLENHADVKVNRVGGIVGENDTDGDEDGDADGDVVGGTDTDGDEDNDGDVDGR